MCHNIRWEGDRYSKSMVVDSSADTDTLLLVRCLQMKDERLDGDRHGSRLLIQPPDVDELEVGELDTVHGDDGSAVFPVLGEEGPHGPTDVALEDQADRASGGETLRQGDLQS